MNFRGTKIFDEYNEDEFHFNNNNNNHNQGERVSISRYIDKESSKANVKNNYQNEDSFAENNNQIQGNFSNNNKSIKNNFSNRNFQSGSMNSNSNNNNLTEKISLIKILIMNYLKEKELDT